jgi:hypothetical protein
MGFAVDEQNESMSSYGRDVASEAPWPLSLAGYAEVVRKGGAATGYANRLVAVYAKLADYLADGRAALVVNHGGVAEMGAVACLPNADHFAWGSHFEPLTFKLWWLSSPGVRREGVSKPQTASTNEITKCGFDVGFVLLNHHLKQQGD